LEDDVEKWHYFNQKNRKKSRLREARKPGDDEDDGFPKGGIMV
jgi:hypothetical protein